MRTYIRRDGERVPLEPTRSQRIRVPVWVDPMAYIQGSSIEKKVMQELIRRGIYFEHTPQTNPLPWFPWMLEEKHTDKWEPDFLLPQYKIWIEIQGSYFHTLPGAVERDSLRFAYIEAVGWRPIFWWEEDIDNRIMELFDAVPEFYFVSATKENAYRPTHPNSKGLPFYEGGFNAQGVMVDHLAGLRAALRKRARPPQGMVKRYATKRRPK